MRIAFTKTILQLAKQDRRIILLTGDLGYSVFEKYIHEVPRQYINMGIAEQNMTGVAAGMALEGKIPIIYSIIPFVTMRNFEQVRNDICYQNLNVKIVGVGAGFAYGPYGHTHHSLEDIGIMRTLPNMTIVCPADPIEAELATRAALMHKGPVYLRIGKAGEPRLYDKPPHFKIGKGIILRKGKDYCLIATSTLVARGIDVVEKLAIQGMQGRLISMHTIKPIDQQLILDSAKYTKAIFTLEEHSVIGGLGSAVSEILAEHGNAIPFRRIGVPDRFTKGMGLQEYMREANGLTVNQIIETIQSILKKNI